MWAKFVWASFCVGFLLVTAKCCCHVPVANLSCFCHTPTLPLFHSKSLTNLVSPGFFWLSTVCKSTAVSQLLLINVESHALLEWSFLLVSLVTFPLCAEKQPCGVNLIVSLMGEWIKKVSMNTVCPLGNRYNKILHVCEPKRVLLETITILLMCSTLKFTFHEFVPMKLNNAKCSKKRNMKRDPGTANTNLFSD